MANGNGKLCIFHLAHTKLDPSKIPLHACNETTIIHKKVKNQAFPPIEMVQTAAIFIMALVLELKRLCSMGLRMAT